MSDENPHIRAAGEAFGWVEEDRWAKGPAVYFMVASYVAMWAAVMTLGVVIVLAVLR